MTGKRKLAHRDRSAPFLDGQQLERGAEPYDLVLYISGATEHSKLALAHVKGVAEKYLHGRYRLAVVDLFQQPEQALTQDIIAVPMLVRTRPLPLRRMIGDLSNEHRLLAGLELVPRSPPLEVADDPDDHP